MKFKIKSILLFSLAISLGSCVANNTLESTNPSIPSVAPSIPTIPSVNPTTPGNESNTSSIPTTPAIESNTASSSAPTAPIVPSQTTTTSQTPEVIDYYKNVNNSLSSNDFILELTNLVNEGFISVSYAQAYSILTESDISLDNPSMVECFYTGVEYAKGTSGSNRKWNREHTWAKSHGFNSESYDAYSDVHHLRATEMGINSTRGNLDFDEVENHNGTPGKDNYGNKWISNVCFEPRDEVKGDVARIMLYMVVKYNDSKLDLSLVDTIPTSGTNFGCYSTLLKWHYQDPVSAQEIHRNNVVYEYQNNRNPFIDHPEYVGIAFPNDYDEPILDESKIKEAENKIAALPITATNENKTEILAVKDYINNNLSYAEINEISNYTKLQDLLKQIENLNQSTPPTESTKPETGDEYYYEFTDQVFSSKNETKSLANVNWTITGEGKGYFGYDANKGHQFGSKNSPFTKLVFTSTEEFNNVTSIVINASTASGATAELSIYVDGVKIGTENLTTAATDYTFNVENISGSIVIEYSQSVGRAVYLKTISIK